MCKNCFEKNNLYEFPEKSSSLDIESKIEEEDRTFIFRGKDMDGNYVTEKVIIRGTKPVATKTVFSSVGLPDRIKERVMEKCIKCRISSEEEEIVYDKNSIPYCIDCLMVEDME